MANEFDTDLTASAYDFVDIFGEDITYKPLSGSNRSIKAIITRQQPGQIDAAPQGSSQKAEIEVVNSAVTGISAAELNLGGDKVTLSRRIGETAADRRIVKLISQDAGIIKLEVY